MLDAHKIYTAELPDLQTIQIGSDDELQRTDEWFEQRCGRFTGSKIKDLMATTHSTSKMEWGRPEKILDFSQTAIKYIFSKAMERKTGIVPKLTDNINFKYGRKAEPIIVKKMLEKNDVQFKEQPYVPINSYLGASPDGAIMGVINGSIGFEAKGAMSWETFYMRVETPLDEKHIDFWQLQTEMLALKTKQLYYVTSYPVKDAIEFLTAEDEDAEKMITGVKNRVVTASEIHQESILHRAKIADIAIEIYLNENISMNDAILMSATNYNFKI